MCIGCKFVNEGTTTTRNPVHCTVITVNDKPNKPNNTHPRLCPGDLERLAGVRDGLGDHLHVGEEAGAEVRLGGGCGLVAVLGGGVALAQEGAPEVPRHPPTSVGAVEPPTSGLKHTSGTRKFK